MGLTFEARQELRQLRDERSRARLEERTQLADLELRRLGREFQEEEARAKRQRPELPPEPVRLADRRRPDRCQAPRCENPPTIDIEVVENGEVSRGWFCDPHALDAELDAVAAELARPRPRRRAAS